jgi:hypothetical protein
MSEGFPGFIPEFDTDDEDESPETKPEKKDKKSKSEKREESDTKSETSKEEDKDIPLEEISDEEKPVVLEAIAQIRETEVQQDLAVAENSSSEEEMAVLADLALLENIQDGLDIDEAYDRTLEELDIEPEPEAAYEEVPQLAGELPLDDDAEEVTLSISSAGSGGSSGPPPPPRPPVSSSPSSGSVPPPPGGGSPHVRTTIPGIGPPTADKAPDSLYYENIDRRPNAAGYFFLGGIVGYLLGRRRGRIKTEKKLLPVQEKLENKVNELHDEVIRREEKIRELIRSQISGQPERRDALMERFESRQEKASEQQAQLYHKEIQPGRLGKVVVERAQIPKAEANISQEVRHLKEPELLAIAERIEIEHVSIRNMYENGRLDLPSLRQIVAEFLRGGDFEGILHHQLRPERVDIGSEFENYSSNRTKQPESNTVPTWTSTNSRSLRERQTHAKTPNNLVRIATVSAGVSAALAVGVIIILLLLRML